MKFLTLDDINFEGKKVLVRVDINSPLDEAGKVQDNDRLKVSSFTISELASKGAKVVVLGHQGRLGGDDFSKLNEHASFLSEHCQKEVKYVDSLTGIDGDLDSMENGTILLLKNVRSFSHETDKISPEEHNKNEVISYLEPKFDFFVNDAFSVSHRAQASVVGFINIPNIAGRQMEKELKGLSKISECDHPYICVFGGAKPKDVYKLLKYNLENDKIEYALCAGFLGMSLMIAKGVDLGHAKTFLEEKGYALPESADLLNKTGDKIVLPVDVALDQDGRKEVPISELPSDSMIDDIGDNTIALFKEKIKDAKTIYLKGPMGHYEDANFAKGTKEIFSAVLDSDAFTIAGGGHTVSSIEELGLDPSKLSYLSLAGGALVAFMAGEELPGILALEISFDSFKK